MRAFLEDGLSVFSPTANSHPYIDLFAAFVRSG